jgi:hypothetical protein
MSKPDLKAIADTDPAVEASTTPNADPFDLTNLRLNQSFTETAGVKKLLTTVPVRKPGRQEFIRVNSSEKYHEPLALIELKEDREYYLLPPAIARQLPGEFVMVMMFTAINRQGVTFLWPVRLPNPDGRVNEWHRTAMEGAELAMKRWLRITPNMSLGAYEFYQAVDSLTHPVVGRLRGL